MLNVIVIAQQLLIIDPVRQPVEIESPKKPCSILKIPTTFKWNTLAVLIRFKHAIITIYKYKRQCKQAPMFFPNVNSKQIYERNRICHYTLPSSMLNNDLFQTSDFILSP